MAEKELVLNNLCVIYNKESNGTLLTLLKHIFVKGWEDEFITDRACDGCKARKGVSREIDGDSNNDSFIRGTYGMLR